MVFTSTGLWYAFWFSILIAVFLLIPYCLDVWWTYKLAQERDKIVQDMMKSSIQEYISRVKNPHADSCCEQVEKTIESLFDAVMANLKEPIEGISGFTRGMIAFAVILILGIATMLILFATSGDPQLVNNIISMLGATLAAVVGFYFGGRTTQEAVNQANKNQQQTDTTRSQAKQVTQKQDIVPVLKVNGIKIGKTAVFENGVGWIPNNEVDIFGYWDTYGKDSLEMHMASASETKYSLYCNIESSIPYGQFDVYVEPSVINQKDFETRPLINGRQNFIQMIPHPKHNTWYVKDFAWFNNENWRAPGEYILVLKKGYLKQGHANGTIPIWMESEEFKITLT